MMTICAQHELEGHRKVLKAGDPDRLSHGLCRFHELEGYELSHTLAPLEAIELELRRNPVFYGFVAIVVGYLIYQAALWIGRGMPV